MTHCTTNHSPIEKLRDDPWALAPQERHGLLAEFADSQETWLRRLPDLVEPPTPDGSFPAFLLDTERFAALRAAIGTARCSAELDTATADELQRFVDCYRDYLGAAATARGGA